MTIRNLFPLLFVALAAAALGPEKAAAQCWYCGECAFPPEVPNPRMCYGYFTSPVGLTNCIHGKKACDCVATAPGKCFDSDNAAATVTEADELEETLAAIRAGRPISANGLFFYARRGEDFVVRRKCDAVEMGRVAVAEVGTPSAAVVG